MSVKFQGQRPLKKRCKISTDGSDAELSWLISMVFGKTLSVMRALIRLSIYWVFVTQIYLRLQKEKSANFILSSWIGSHLHTTRTYSNSCTSGFLLLGFMVRQASCVRLLFQDLIVNCGYEIDWSQVSRG